MDLVGKLLSHFGVLKIMRPWVLVFHANAFNHSRFSNQSRIYIDIGTLFVIVYFQAVYIQIWRQILFARTKGKKKKGPPTPSDWCMVCAQQSLINRFSEPLSSPCTVQPAPVMPLNWALERPETVPPPWPQCGGEQGQGRNQVLSEAVIIQHSSVLAPLPTLLSCLGGNGKKQRARSEKTLLSRKGRKLPEHRQSQSKTLKSLC